MNKRIAGWMPIIAPSIVWCIICAIGWMIHPIIGAGLTGLGVGVWLFIIMAVAVMYGVRIYEKYGKD